MPRICRKLFELPYEGREPPSCPSASTSECSNDSQIIRWENTTPSGKVFIEQLENNIQLKEEVDEEIGQKSPAQSEETFSLFSRSVTPAESGLSTECGYSTRLTSEIITAAVRKSSWSVEHSEQSKHDSQQSPQTTSVTTTGADTTPASGTVRQNDVSFMSSDMTDGRSPHKPPRQWMKPIKGGSNCGNELSASPTSRAAIEESRRMDDFMILRQELLRDVSTTSSVTPPSTTSPAPALTNGSTPESSSTAFGRLREQLLRDVSCTSSSASGAAASTSPEPDGDIVIVPPHLPLQSSYRSIVFSEDVTPQVIKIEPQDTIIATEGSVMSTQEGLDLGSESYGDKQKVNSLSSVIINHSIQSEGKEGGDVAQPIEQLSSPVNPIESVSTEKSKKVRKLLQPSLGVQSFCEHQIVPPPSASIKTNQSIPLTAEDTSQVREEQMKRTTPRKTRLILQPSALNTLSEPKDTQITNTVHDNVDLPSDLPNVNKKTPKKPQILQPAALQGSAAKTPAQVPQPAAPDKLCDTITTKVSMKPVQVLQPAAVTQQAETLNESSVPFSVESDAKAVFEKHPKDGGSAAKKPVQIIQPAAIIKTHNDNLIRDEEREGCSPCNVTTPKKIASILLPTAGKGSGSPKYRSSASKKKVRFPDDESESPTSGKVTRQKVVLHKELKDSQGAQENKQSKHLSGVSNQARQSLNKIRSGEKVHKKDKKLSKPNTRRKVITCAGSSSSDNESIMFKKSPSIKCKVKREQMDTNSDIETVVLPRKNSKAKFRARGKVHSHENVRRDTSEIPTSAKPSATNNVTTSSNRKGRRLEVRPFRKSGKSERLSIKEEEICRKKTKLDESPVQQPWQDHNDINVSINPQVQLKSSPHEDLPCDEEQLKSLSDSLVKQPWVEKDFPSEHAGIEQHGKETELLSSEEVRQPWECNSKITISADERITTPLKCIEDIDQTKSQMGLTPLKVSSEVKQTIHNLAEYNKNIDQSNVSLVEVSLDGFKSFASKTTIQISKGFNCIVGMNGSGKSNLIDAVCFVLGLPSELLRCKRLSDLISKNGNTDASVTVHFTVGGDSVFVKRRVFKTGNNIYYLNNKPSDATTVRSQLKVLGVDIEFPQRFVILQQHTTSLLQLNPLSFLEHIERLCGTHLLEKQCNQISEELNRIQQQKESLTLRLSSLSAEQKLTSPMIAKWKAVNEQFSDYSDAEVVWILKAQLCLDSIHTTRQQRLCKLSRHHKDLIVEKDHLYSEKRNIRESLSSLTKQLKSLNDNITIEEESYTEKTDCIAQLQREERTAKRLLSNIDTRRDEIRIVERELMDTRRELADRSAAYHKKSEVDNDIDTAINLKEASELLILQKEVETSEQLQSKREIELQQLHSESASENQKLTDLNSRLLSCTERVCNASRVLSETQTKLKEFTTQLHHQSEKISVCSSRVAVRYRDTIYHLMNKNNNILGFAYQWLQVDARYALAVNSSSVGWIANTVFVKNTEAADLVVESFRNNRIGIITSIVLPPHTSPEFSKLAPQKLVLESAACFIFLSPSKPNTPIALNPNYSLSVLSYVQARLQNVIIAEDLQTGHDLIVSTPYRISVVTRSGDLIQRKGVYTGGDSVSRITAECSLQVIGSESVITSSVVVDGEYEKLKQKVSETKTTLQAQREERTVLQEEKNSTEQQQLEVRRVVKSIHETIQRQQRCQLENMKSLELLKEVIQTKKISLSLDDDCDHNKLKEILSSCSSTAAILVDISVLQKTVNKHEALLQQKRQKLLLMKRPIMSTTTPQLCKVERGMKEHKKTLAQLRSKSDELKKEAISTKSRESIMERDIGKMEKELIAMEADISEARGEISETEKQRKRLQKDLRKNEICNRRDVVFNKEEYLSHCAGSYSSTEEWKSSIAYERQLLDAKRTSLTANAALIDTSKIESFLVAVAERDDISHELNTLTENYNTCQLKLEETQSVRLCVIQNKMIDINKCVSSLYKKLTTESSDCVLTYSTEGAVLFVRGVGVKVRPPGHSEWLPPTKLSGGQRSLSATSISIALQQSFPSPFYLFDEIDAALDAEKARRLGCLLSESGIQMLCISLRHQFYDRANQLIGVYQSPNGISEVVQSEF